MCIKICNGCGKEFKKTRSNRRNKYCSLECRIKYGIKVREKKYKCLSCGKEIETGKSKYCSEECYNKNKVKIICRVCGKEVIRNKALADRPYCSRKCYLIAHKEEGKKIVSCSNCGKLIKRKASLFKGEKAFCCNKCQSSYYSGERHIGYKKRNKCLICGNDVKDKRNIYCSIECSAEAKHRKISVLSKKKKSNYNLSEWTYKFKYRIRERDLFKCQMCDITEKEYGHTLDVHHINFNQRDNRLNNLITLCHSCHGRLHAFKRIEENGKCIC